MISKKLVSIICVLVFTAFAFPQEKEAHALIEKVKSRYDKVHDYRVTVEANVEMSGVNIPKIQAELLFKQPNKMKINSDGFAMLPKQGLNFSPTSLFKGDFVAIYERNETFENYKCAVIKIVPSEETSDVATAVFWIDKESSVIRKAIITSKTNGISTIQLQYDEKLLKQYPLPSNMKLSFPFNNARFSMRRSHANEESEKTVKKNENKNAIVTISYTNYKINAGIADSDFESKKK
ncbi:MAG: hypothetical protein LWX56_02250 [Ignavibacteria bacterium]|nr:hypothetical protein [Ignavibacteria bacterium]